MTNQEKINQEIKRGVGHHQAGRLGEAEKVYREILSRQPNQPDALHLLGVVGAQMGHAAEAVEIIRRAIAIRPAVAAYHNDLGNALRDLKRLDDAEAAYREAVRLKPDFVLAIVNLGNVLCDRGKVDEGIAAYQSVVAMRPDFAGVHANLGRALRDKGLFDESIASLREAIRLKPDYAEARHNLGLVLLLKGDYANGWAEHEWRLKLRTFSVGRREFAGPLWDGGDLKGRRILLHVEQGLGDSIQFVRYAPIVAERGGRVIVQCQQALCRLFRGVRGVERVVGQNEAMLDFDVHCPLLSLPKLFGTTMGTIPTAVPYVSVENELAGLWAARLGESSEKRIGLVWAGSAGYANDRNRSLPLASLMPLFEVSGLKFYSLQKGGQAAQISVQAANHELIDHTPELNDFADTAALIANLHLVISVDTAVAHLAGAMGKPVWVLLPFSPDWRWLLDRDDSPWYSTARLFRQTTAGNWEEVIARVVEALR
jgi:Flp pilus assembly protein TadD